VSKLLSLDELFKGRHFRAEIIVLCVRWYLGYKLSYRDLAEMMAERGVSVAPSTNFCSRSNSPQSSRSAGIGSHARSAAHRAFYRPNSPASPTTGIIRLRPEREIHMGNAG
jgi:hypothetical protein